MKGESSPAFRILKARNILQIFNLIKISFYALLDIFLHFYLQCAYSEKIKFSRYSTTLVSDL